MEIKFPRGDDDPNTVTIIGAQDNVDECKDHLLNLMEEYMQDIVEEEDMEAYMNPKPFQALLDPGLGSQGQGGSSGQGGQKKEEVSVVAGFCRLFFFFFRFVSAYVVYSYTWIFAPRLININIFYCFMMYNFV